MHLCSELYPALAVRLYQGETVRRSAVALQLALARNYIGGIFQTILFEEPKVCKRSLTWLLGMI
jgi:hypothetical protein